MHPLFQWELIHWKYGAPYLLDAESVNIKHLLSFASFENGSLNPDCPL